MSEQVIHLTTLAGQAAGDAREDKFVTLADFEEMARQMDECELPDDVELIQL